MDYLQKLKYHYRPEKGWVNDPNGLVYFDGYYHLFYQHIPDFEAPTGQPVHWGHARTKNFLDWEELPIALYPDTDYDDNGCWSGTAIVKDDTLFLFYASIHSGELIQTVSIAYSKDGINFEKYSANPVIPHFPTDGSRDFRDPAVCKIGGEYFCVMASGHVETHTGRLLLYKSTDLFNWEYIGVMREWEGCKFAECPSLVEVDDGVLLTSSVCTLDDKLFFRVMHGELIDGKFVIKNTAEIDKGPDQYAGQVFRDHLGRCILISWFPGWRYARFAERDIGCFSLPREITVKDGVIKAYPPEEVRHLLTDCDPAVKITDKGFTVERCGRSAVVYKGNIKELKILRDGYMLEIYINGGEEVYTVLL